MIKNILKISLALLISLQIAFANNSGISNDLQNGDVIFIALNCYSCPMIESEEGGKFSHSGVIIKSADKLYVAQALGPVHVLPLEKFIKQARKNTEVAFYRPREFQNVSPNTQNFLSIFQKHFYNLPFDSKYRWNNFDEQAREKLYCSEFVAKFLNHFLQEKLEPKPMDYSRNWDFWQTQFGGDVPQGEPGNSPVSLARNPQLSYLFSL